MRGKLIPGSVSISQMLHAQGICSRTFHKWSRVSFSKSKFVPQVNNSCLRLQIYTSQRFGLACSAKSVAASVKEDTFLELGNLMKRGLLKRKDIDKALLNEASYRDHGNSLLVLQCISKLPDISPENRVALSEQFLAKVKSISGIVTEAHCLQVLECYLQSRYFENLDSFLSAMENYGVNQSNEIKLMIFKCLSVNGMKKKEFGSDLCRELENSNSENTEELFAAKIYDLALSGGIAKALKEMKQMKEDNVEIGSSIYTSLLKAAVLKGDTHFIQDLSRDVLLDQKTFSDDQIMEILENVALSEQYNVLSDVKLLCADEVFFRTSQIVLVKLLHRDKVESAYAFMNHLFDLNYNCESVDKEVLFNGICKTFIEESCKINCSVNDLTEKCLQMRKLKKCLYAMEYALYCCLGKADIKKSLAIIQIMFNQNISLEPHYFWPLLITFKEKFGDEGIIFILDKMTELKVPINPETLMDYVFPQLSNLRFAKDVLGRVTMTEAQQELFAEVFLLYKIKNGLFKESLDFMAEYFARAERSYTFLQDCLLQALVENPDCEEAVILAKKTKAVDPFLVISKLWSHNDKRAIRQLSNHFKKHGVYTKSFEEAQTFINLNKDQPLVKEAVSGLINDRAVEEETVPGSLKMKKLSRFEEFMLLEQAEIHLAELKAKNLNTTGQRLRVMTLYMKNQMYDKAVQAKNEVLQLMGKNPDFSPGYLIRLARLSAHENDVDGAIRYLNHLKEKYPAFKIGSITGLVLCHYFILNNRYKEMLAVLRVLPKWENNPENLLSTPVQFLRAVAQLGMPELTDLVFKIMLQKKFISVNMNSLQVYTKTYLCANDLEGAVKEYGRVTAEYGIVSNTISVLWAAVQEGRLDLAERVTRTCLKKTKSKYSLVLILSMIAKTGDVNILMSYSEQLGFPLDDDFMIRKYFQGEIPCCPSTAFKTFILAAMKMGLRYDHFVEGAIKSAIKEKNFEKAAELLDFFKSNKIELSEDQVSRLGNHLELGAIDAASKNING